MSVPDDHILSETAATIRRFISLQKASADAIALWIFFSHMHDVFHTSPILTIQSPTFRCGKTTLCRILFRLVPNPSFSSNITTAAIFRLIDKSHPTLIIDEVDSFFDLREEMRSILNSGHTRDGAVVVRCDGKDYEPKSFSTWTPKILSLIGNLPGTVEDRSIMIRLRRKLPGERVEKFAPQKHDQDLQDLAEKIGAWAKAHQEFVGRCESAITDGLNDRAADNWAPLIQIADMAGNGWSERARSAAIALRGGFPEERPVVVELFEDLRRLFVEADCRLRWPSNVLCQELTSLEERPWADWRNGKALTPRQLADLLRPFGIAPKLLRFGDGTVARGYEVEQFADCFARYLGEG